MRDAGGDKGAAARLLGMTKSMLSKKLRFYGL